MGLFFLLTHNKSKRVTLSKMSKPKIQLPSDLVSLLDDDRSQETSKKLILLQKLGLTRALNSPATFDKRIVFILTQTAGNTMNESNQKVKIDKHDDDIEFLNEAIAWKEK